MLTVIDTLIRPQAPTFENPNGCMLPSPSPPSFPLPSLLIPSFPFPPLLLSPLPSPSLFFLLPFPSSFPSLPLEVGLSCKLPQRGLGRSPSGNRIWCILLSLKIWHLVAPILLIFLRINWPQCIRFFLIVFLTIFPLGACTHRPLPMRTLAATALGKSVPMNSTSAVMFLMLRRLNWVDCHWQLREVAIEEGVESTGEFHSWLQFSHDRRLLFCGAISVNDASESTDKVVVLRPTWLLEACQNLLSTESRCCVQVSVVTRYRILCQIHDDTTCL